RWLLVGYSLYAFTWQATTGFLPAYLELGKGFDPIVAKIAFAFLFGVGVIIKPVAGRLGDTFSRKSLSAIVLIIAGIALSGVILSTSPIIAVLAVIVFAAGLMAFPPLMQAFLMDSFPTESAGGDLGATRSIYIGVGSVGPTYVGVIADMVSYDLAFVGLVGSLFLSAGIIMFGS
ncbi:MAG: MFS transporter, partial [Halobacteriaceae archaeon]